MEAISDLPMHNDIDADYSPQYVKLARIIRDKIESGEYRRGDPVPTAVLAREHKISMRWPGPHWRCSPRTGTSPDPLPSSPTT